MKKWIIGCGAVIILALAAAAGLGYCGCLKLREWNVQRKNEIKARQVLVESGIAQRRKYLESHLTQEIRDSVSADFYTYDGFRDWWRIPLVFPYQLMCVDTLDRACLEKYDPKYPVSDPNKSSSGVFGDITRVATDNRMLVFETKIGAATSYGMLRYESGVRSDFGQEPDMWRVAAKEGYSGAHVLVSLDDLFDAYYDWNKTFVEKSPAGDSLKAAHEK